LHDRDQSASSRRTIRVALGRATRKPSATTPARRRAPRYVRTTNIAGTPTRHCLAAIYFHE
jgi:hypothetical protein